MDCHERFHQFANRYTLGLVAGGDVYAAKCDDAFEWLHEHFAEVWDPTTEKARREVAWFVEKGRSESVARDKARREFINRNAALPISKEVGIHTLADRMHLHKGYSATGFDEEGEDTSSGFQSGWETQGRKEQKKGFPIRDESLY